MPELKTHSPEDLTAALEHVIYEFWQFQDSIRKYNVMSQVNGNAAIEIRVLRHRVLLEFFHRPTRVKNNILAWDYIETWDLHKEGKRPQWYCSYMDRCHTMLAHISNDRTEISRQGKKDWEKHWLEEVEPHLRKTIKFFLENLSPEHQQQCRHWIDKWNISDRFLFWGGLRGCGTVQGQRKP